MARKPKKPTHVGLISELARLTAEYDRADNGDLTDRRERAIEALAGLTDRYPTAFAVELCTIAETAGGWASKEVMSDDDVINQVHALDSDARANAVMGTYRALMERQRKRAKESTIDAMPASAIRPGMASRDIRGIVVLPDASCIDGVRLRRVIAALPRDARVTVERAATDVPVYVMRCTWSTGTSKGRMTLRGQHGSNLSAWRHLPSHAPALIDAMAESQYRAPMAVAA